MTSLPFALPSRPAHDLGLMHVEAVRRAPLNQFFEGLARTGLLADVEEGLHTLLAPVRARVAARVLTPSSRARCSAAWVKRRQ